MDDLISREQAIKATWQDTGYTDPFNVMTAIRDRIKQLPPIQPKRGKWLPDNNNYIYEQYVCSECKNSFKVDTCMGKPMWNFCPNCGADMREVKT